MATKAKIKLSNCHIQNMLLEKNWFGLNKMRLEVKGAMAALERVCKIRPYRNTKQEFRILNECEREAMKVLKEYRVK